MLNSVIRNVFNRRGYQVLKYPITPFKVLSVFDMAISLLMAKKSANLSFIQVGANDGRYNDPLFKFITKHPWHGVLVEPQPDVFQRLCANYGAYKQRLVFENVAIGASGGAITMYKARAGDRTRSGDTVYDASVVSTDRKVVAAQLGVSADKVEAFTVPCISLDDLVNKHNLAELDLLQIDAEGYDYAVLQTLDLKRTPPTIIQFEHGHLSPPAIDDVVQFLGARGYRVLFGGYQIDTVAVHESFLSQLI